MSVLSSPPRRVVATGAVIALVAVATATPWLRAGSVEPGPAPNGITLNTSSWSPDDANAYWMQASIGGTVRVDPNGCVHWGGDRPDWAQNVIWPAGYTASRHADGTVTISDPDGVVVSGTGHRLRVGGGAPFPGVRLACTAAGADGTAMITDVLAPLTD